MSERKNWNEDPEIAAQVELVRSLAKDLQRGDLLQWTAIESALQLERWQPRLRYIVNKWRRDLQKGGIETWAIPSIGVKLLTDEECLTVVAVHRGKRARRQHGKILRAMKNTRVELLSNNQRLMQAAIIEHSENARRESRQVVASGNVSSDRQKLVQMAKSLE